MDKLLEIGVILRTNYLNLELLRKQITWNWLFCGQITWSQSYFGDKLLEIRVIVWTNYLKLECIFPQNGTAVLKGSSISPLGYWQKVNQSPTQTKPYNTLPPFWTARFLVFVRGRTCLVRSSQQSRGTKGERFIRFWTWGNPLFFKKSVFHDGREIRTQANYCRTRNQKIKQDFPSSYWNPRAVPSVVMGHFCSLAAPEKTCFSHIALHRCRDSSLTGHGSPPN